MGRFFSRNDRDFIVLIYGPYITRRFDYVTNQRRLWVQLSYRFPAGKRSRTNSYKTDRADEIGM